MLRSLLAAVVATLPVAMAVNVFRKARRGHTPRCQISLHAYVCLTYFFFFRSLKLIILEYNHIKNVCMLK